MIRIFISKVVSSEFTVIEIKIPPLQPFLSSFGQGSANVYNTVSLFSSLVCLILKSLLSLF